MLREAAAKEDRLAYRWSRPHSNGNCPQPDLLPASAGLSGEI
jgi:hypothetical protein